MSIIRTLMAAAVAMIRGLGVATGEAIAAAARQGAALGRLVGLGEGVSMHGTFTLECRSATGELLWAHDITNLVTTAGKNHLLDTYFAGSAYTAALYLGVITSTGYTTGAAAGDTMASHVGWAESTAYSNATRPAVSWSSASGGSKASSAVVFNINAADTIKGAFLTTNNTKGGTTGTLYSAGLFTGGDQPVVNGNTLSITYTASA